MKRRTFALAAALLPSLLLAGCGVPVVGRMGTLVGLPEPGPSVSSIEDVRAQAALHPTEAYWPYRLGVLHMEEDSLGRAEAALRMALQREPGHVPSVAALSNILFQTGRHAEAIDRLEAARDAAPAGAQFPREMIEALALHYDASGRPDLARAVLAGTDANATRATRAYLALRSEHPDEANEPARGARDARPKSAVQHNNYGITRLRAGDPAEARKAFERAIDLDPKLPGPYYNMAILERFYLLHDDEAERWYVKYRALSESDPDGLAEVLGKAPVPLAGRKDER